VRSSRRVRFRPGGTASPRPKASETSGARMIHEPLALVRFTGSHSVQGRVLTAGSFTPMWVSCSADECFLHLLRSSVRPGSSRGCEVVTLSLAGPARADRPVIPFIDVSFVHYPQVFPLVLARVFDPGGFCVAFLPSHLFTPSQ